MRSRPSRLLRLIRLAVRAPADRAEQVLSAMLEMAPSGIEQVDDGDTVEFAVYGAPGELPELEPGEAEVAGEPGAEEAAELSDEELEAAIAAAEQPETPAPVEEPSEGEEDVPEDAFDRAVGAGPDEESQEQN